MTDWVPWFSYQLKASGEAFVWAAQQLRPADHFTLPPEPGYLGTWPAARHIWHVSGYERCLALPALQGWLDGNSAKSEKWPDDDADWEAASTGRLESLRYWARPSRLAAAGRAPPRPTRSTLPSSRTSPRRSRA